MTTTLNYQAKDTLARLLANENVTIEHRKVSTAFYIPETRIVVLPIWKNMSEPILDTISAHEIGHLLYSPGFDKWDQTEYMSSWVNVVEDARIEKLIKRKYPGLNKSFYFGYKELIENNFFETQGRDLNTYSLIDRINLHFKCVPLVPFTEKEKPFIKEIEDCETFEEVLAIVKKLQEYCEDKETNAQDIQLNNTGEEEGFGTPGDTVESNNTQSDEESEEDFDEESEEDSDEDTDDWDVDANQLQQSETDTAWERNQEQLIDDSAKSYTYLEFPKVNYDDVIVPWQKFYKNLEEQEIRINSILSYDYVEMANKNYMEFKTNSIKSVNYLVKEFEMKKSADEYKRASVAKTGVIDTNLIHSYRWNEDIFKKMTVVPGAKNHGMIFFLDWSGSMVHTIYDTVKQLYNLIWFCNKAQIPFEVYSFTDSGKSSWRLEYFDKTANTIYMCEHIKLNQLFSSTMKTNVLEKSMKAFWCLVRNIDKYGSNYTLGSTPLNESIYFSKEIANRFLKKNKVQKLNLLYLTDGESNPLTYLKARKNHPYLDDGVVLSVFHRNYSNSGEFVIRDNGRMYKLDKYDVYQQTKTMLTWLKDNINANIIGYRLCKDVEARSYTGIHCGDKWEIHNKKWKTDRVLTFNIGGYDTLFLIKNDRLLGANSQEIQFDENANKSTMKKAFMAHMRSKSYNKILLNSFISLIA
jgi:hypothetical protein